MAPKVEEKSPPGGEPEPTGIQVPVTEGVTPPPPPPPSNGQTGDGTPPKGDSHQHTMPKTFTVEDIEKARKEEKDKLYNRLSSMEEELKAVKAEREAREKAAKDAERQAAEAAKAKAEEEMSAKELLAKQQQEWEQKFSQVQADQERAAALLEQERKFSALQDFRAIRISEETENIMPELLDFVSGNSEEEIEQSIERLKAKTTQILGNVQQAQQQARQQLPGTKVTQPPVGPMEQQPGFETLSADDIRGMDMETYKKRRSQLLGAASQNRNQGLFS